MNDMMNNTIPELKPPCCEENRKEISTLNDRVTWLITEVNAINNTLTANFTEICALEQRIAYLELPWYKKLWK